MKNIKRLFGTLVIMLSLVIMFSLETTVFAGDFVTKFYKWYNSGVDIGYIQTNVRKHHVSAKHQTSSGAPNTAPKDGNLYVCINSVPDFGNVSSANCGSLNVSSSLDNWKNMGATKTTKAQLGITVGNLVTTASKDVNLFKSYVNDSDFENKVLSLSDPDRYRLGQAIIWKYSNNETTTNFTGDMLSVYNSAISYVEKSTTTENGTIDNIKYNFNFDLENKDANGYYTIKATSNDITKIVCKDMSATISIDGKDITSSCLVDAEDYSNINIKVPSKEFIYSGRITVTLNYTVAVTEEVYQVKPELQPVVNVIVTSKPASASGYYDFVTTAIPTGALKINKSDENGKFLSGAKFRLVGNGIAENIDEIAISGTKEYVKNGNSIIFTTQGETVTIEELPLGTYSLEEIEVPVGFIKDKSIRTINIVDKADNILVVDVKNTKVMLDLGLEKWVAKVEAKINDKYVETYKGADRNKEDNEVEKDKDSRAGDIFVSAENLVTYKIRIYNHGNVAGTAAKISDTIPAGLEFVADNETNKKYGWKYDEKTGKVYTEYLADKDLIAGHQAEKSAHIGYNYNSDGNKNLAPACNNCKYVDVYVVFKVKEDAFKTATEGTNTNKRLVNVAEIVEYKSEYDGKWPGYKAEDIDSKANNHPDNHDFEAEESKREKDKYYREDDEDIAVVVPAKFDLALEKWVSKVIRTDKTTGEITVTPYDDRNILDNNVENRAGDIKVRKGDIVVYKIRVYNQGNIAGYAEEIKDSVPAGLEYLDPIKNEEKIKELGYDINTLYGWKEENGQIKTSFLGKENDEAIKEKMAKLVGEDYKAYLLQNAEGYEESKFAEYNTPEQIDNYLKAIGMYEMYNQYKSGTLLKEHNTGVEHIGKNFENGEYKPGSCENCAYNDIEIAFKVGQTVNEKKEVISRIINLAQISNHSTIKDTDEYKYPDIDSIPNNNDGFEENKTREDDEDIAVIVPDIFDLELQKWITSYEKVVEENSEIITTEQSYETSREDKGGKLLVKIDLDEKKLDSTKIKIKYTIRVENKGNIPGYVKEVTDFIPGGLEFYVEDNLDEQGNAFWAVDGDSLVTSDGYASKLNTILNPGEAHELTLVLRWVNSKENLGTKTNTAEISKDYNQWEVPDIDSDPGNFNRENWNDWEDDEDEVPLLLSVKTGEKIIYFGIVFGVLAIGLIATVIIKKKLANRI